MTNHMNAGDEHGLYHLTAAEEKQQTAYLDSLPKSEQLRLAAKAMGIPVTELLLHIAALHADLEDAENDRHTSGIPFADPLDGFEMTDPGDAA